MALARSYAILFTFFGFTFLVCAEAKADSSSIAVSHSHMAIHSAGCDSRGAEVHGAFCKWVPFAWINSDQIYFVAAASFACELPANPQGARARNFEIRSGLSPPSPSL